VNDEPRTICICIYTELRQLQLNWQFPNVCEHVTGKRSIYFTTRSVDEGEAPAIMKVHAANPDSITDE
jgi:hypothetical protein